MGNAHSLLEGQADRLSSTGQTVLLRPRKTYCLLPNYSQVFNSKKQAASNSSRPGVWTKVINIYVPDESEQRNKCQIRKYIPNNATRGYHKLDKSTPAKPPFSSPDGPYLHSCTPSPYPSRVRLPGQSWSSIHSAAADAGPLTGQAARWDGIQPIRRSKQSITPCSQ